MVLQMQFGVPKISWADFLLAHQVLKLYKKIEKLFLAWYTLLCNVKV